jgi:hypothetical protein
MARDGETRLKQVAKDSKVCKPMGGRGTRGRMLGLVRALNLSMPCRKYLA